MAKQRSSKSEATRRDVATARRGREQDGPSPPAPDEALLEKEIRLGAYYRYLEREGEPGDPVSDWLEAETDVRGRRAPDADPGVRVSDEEAGL